MANHPLDVSVVICAYNEERWDELVAAVQSVKRQTLRPRDIIVVIDHNRGLLDRARKHLQGIFVAENGGELGASAARNSGVAATRGTIIAFIDDDAEAEPEWLESLVHHYEDDRIFGVGGALDPAWVENRPGWFPEEFNWVLGCTYKGMPESTAPVRNLIAANMSLRRGVFEDLRGFRSGFGNMKALRRSKLSFLHSFAGDEETELCIRALRRWPQGTWLYDPNARVRHRVPAGRATLKYFLSRCYDEGLGKARLVQLTGTHSGLASERTYASHVLPNGIARAFADLFFRHDLSGLGRALAIASGLAVTTLGYLVGATIGRQMRPLNSIGEGDIASEAPV